MLKPGTTQNCFIRAVALPSSPEAARSPEMTNPLGRLVKEFPWSFASATLLDAESLRDSLQWGVMPALRRRFRIFSFRLREMMSGMTMIFLIPAPRPATSHRPPLSSFRTSGAATAVTENAGGEVESCEGEVVAPRLAWSMPPGVGVLEIRAWEPARGRFRYFPAALFQPRSHAENSPNDDRCSFGLRRRREW